MNQHATPNIKQQSGETPAHGIRPDAVRALTRSRLMTGTRAFLLSCSVAALGTALAPDVSVAAAAKNSKLDAGTGLTIGKVAVEAGMLVITGTTRSAGQRVELDHPKKSVRSLSTGKNK